MSVKVSLSGSSIPASLPSGEYGVYVEDTKPLKIGDCLIQAYNATEARMNLTGLASGLYGYPMTVELEARGEDCYIRQGASDIVLGPNNERLQADTYRTITVEDDSEAYIAVVQVAAGGDLAATRIDKTIY